VQNDAGPERIVGQLTHHDNAPKMICSSKYDLLSQAKDHIRIQHQYFFDELIISNNVLKIICSSKYHLTWQANEQMRIEHQHFLDRLISSTNGP
jgi:hypothetical protein